MLIQKVETKKGEKWRCVLNAPRDPVTGKRTQIVRRGDTKKEAVARAQAALAEITEHGLVNKQKASKMFFDQFAAEWIKTYATGVKVSSVRARSNQVDLLNKYIAKVTIDKVTPKMYQNILNDLHKNKYADASIEGVHSCANMIFKQAIVWQMIQKSPTEHAKLPKRQLTVKDVQTDKIGEKYFEKSELREFLQAVDEHGLPGDKETFYSLAFTGMRLGEFCALEWNDLNLETKQLGITKTLYCPTNNMQEYELLTPKTSGSIRVMPIDQILIDILRKHKALQNKIKLLDRANYHGNFVLAHDNGYPYPPKHIEIRMARIMNKTKINKNATPHTLRHTFVSMLTEAGVDIKTIMDRVGHTDMRTTLTIYTHVTEKMQKNASDKLNEYIGNLFQEKQ